MNPKINQNPQFHVERKFEVRLINGRKKLPHVRLNEIVVVHFITVCNYANVGRFRIIVR